MYRVLSRRVNSIDHATHIRINDVVLQTEITWGEFGLGICLWWVGMIGVDEVQNVEKWVE